MKRLDPMMDFVFKALFGKEDKVSKRLLVSFLNDIFVDKGQDKIESIVYLNPFNYKEFEADKLSILDIKAKTDKNEIINIEVQVKSDKDYRKRSLYYWSKAYAESIQEAETYSSLKKTIVINIMGYNIITESDKIHTSFKVLEENDHFVLTEDLQIHYLELAKLPSKEIEDLEGLELWLAFLKEAGKEDSENKLEELKERSEIMKEVINELDVISADERMREVYRAREKYRLDMLSQLRQAEREAEEKGMEKGMEKGIEQGLEKGIKEAKIDSLIKLLRIRFGEIPVELEERIHGLSIEKLDEIIGRIFELKDIEEVEEYL